MGNTETWTEYPDNNDTWTKYPDYTETWTEYPDNTETWTEYPDNTETWPEYPDNTETWTEYPDYNETACEDKWAHCEDLVENMCYDEETAENCRESCGLCPGMTPAASVTCYDYFSNCWLLCSYGQFASYGCQRTCGMCW